MSVVFTQLLIIPWQLLKPLQTPKVEENTTHQLLHRNQVPPIFREPYIVEGYRKTDTNFAYACKSAFRWSNDIGNVWTHFIPFCIFFVWFFLEWKWRIDFTDPYYYPLACLWAGSCCYTLFSSTAHLLGCVSSKVRTICFFLDYLGIAIYLLGGGLTAFFYHLPLGSTILTYKYPLLTYNLIMAIGATLISGLSRFYWHRYRFVIRITTFLFPYFTTSYPNLIRVFIVCIPTGEDCTTDSAILGILREIITLLSVFFYITKIPERCAPGKFDYTFQSHQLFHVTSALQTFLLLYSIPIDAVTRREALTQFEAAAPDLLTTFGVFGVGTMGCLLIVIVLGSLVIRGSLKPTVDHLKED